MSFLFTILTIFGALQCAFASPTSLQRRQTTNALSNLGAVIAEVDPTLGATVSLLVDDILGGLGDDASDAAQIFSAILTAIEDTVAAQVTATPTDIPQATSILSSIFSATPTILLEQVFDLIENGLVGPNLGDELQTLIAGTFSGQNSETNVNPINPSPPIYPQKSCLDAPYTLTEAQLRQVIYIPDNFTYGAVPPVILVPGTGNTGYETFDGNYIPLLQGSTFADPVWLNIPDQLLDDIQVNSEYVAYATNYISSITNTNVSIISWSQGGIDAQWAFKYWPSTRNVTSNFIPHSPDFHGTVLAYILCPGFPQLPCPPAVIQQEYNSNFISVLRNNGGDSAYVPSTTVFSATDEVVQPQSPVTNASAYLLDARNVGVSNSQVQAVCGGIGPAGGFYTHEGVLYNPLAYALTKDALINGGPGQVSRLDLTTVCNEIVSPGLDLVDVLITEESIVIALASIALYVNKTFVEPPIMSYALSNATNNCTTSSSSSVSSTTSTSASSTSSSLTSSVGTTSVSASSSVASSSIASSSSNALSTSNAASTSNTASTSAVSSGVSSTSVFSTSIATSSPVASSSIVTSVSIATSTATPIYGNASTASTVLTSSASIVTSSTTATFSTTKTYSTTNTFSTISVSVCVSCVYPTAPAQTWNTDAQPSPPGCGGGSCAPSPLSWPASPNGQEQYGPGRQEKPNDNEQNGPSGGEQAISSSGGSCRRKHSTV